jgi:SOS-response transcriptional repressor LexA
VTATATRKIRLTPLQRRARLALIAHIEDHGHPPTFQELADTLHISKTAARWRITKLVEQGAIRRAPGAKRGIEIADDIEIERDEDTW